MLVREQKIHFERAGGDESVDPSRTRDVEGGFQERNVRIEIHFAVENEDFLSDLER